MSETKTKEQIVDKTAWPQGPWQPEPDEKRWTDEETGLPCIALRGPVGAWCGYVGVPVTHPAFGRDYYKSDFPLDEVISGKAMADVKAQHQINEIQVHGGLTYAGADEQRGTDRWWFGFDCAHAGDWCPSYQDIVDLGAATDWGGTVEYRDLAYTISECGKLARQLAR